jgi:nitrate/TMAO reductase-like tetraheme cytochrome c subunit
MSPSRHRTRAALLLGAVGLALAGIGAMAWSAADRLEQANEFCLGCHLTPEVRLHGRIGRDFERRPPASLAARHAEAGAADRDGEPFRCIECHGGTSWPGRLRIKLMAASDAFWYASGHFEEPERMAWPLWDEDCRKCHTTLGAKQSRDWDSIPFHEVMNHNENLRVACVECHQVHDAGVDPEASFLRASHVRAQCARCHSDFRDEG